MHYMLNQKFKFGIVIFLIILFFTPLSYPQAKTSQLVSKLDNLLSDKFFESTLISVDAFDLTEGKILYQKNNKYLLRPASNLKILTSTAGLIFLGPEYEFETSLYYRGDISNNVLNGDLFFVGGFDPDFTTQDLEYFVNAVQDLDIKEINGNLYADVSRIDSLFWGSGWMWDDDPSSDAPYLSSLNINDNSIEVFVRGVEVDSIAEVILNPSTSYVHLENETVTTPANGEDNYEITRDWINRNNTIIVKGKINLNNSNINSDSSADMINIFRPDLYFLTLFEEALRDEGIITIGEKQNSWLPYDAAHLYTYHHDYKDIITRLNKESNNLSAEMTLYALADKYYGKPATAENGLKLINDLISLAGFNPENYRIVDGSGVSHYNLVSAELILGLLKYIYYEKPELYEILYDSFPVAGVDGTLEKRMKDSPAENNVHAKTGTLSGVSTLSGYLTAANGNKIAFSILVQNYVDNLSAAKYYQDQICQLLAEYK